MSDVFLSYKRDDERKAAQLVTALRTAGLDVWWDHDIPASAPWESTIEQALGGAKAVVVAWSPSAVESENVRSEARWARSRNRLVQLFFGPCDPPLFFGERQGVDLTHWSGHPADPSIARLIAAVRAVVAGSEDGQPSSTPAPAMQSKPADEPRSVAVLPFANLTGDPGKDYLGDGMAEELIHRLVRGSDLRVPSRTSVFAYKGRDIDIRNIAKELGVETVLEGSVRTAGERIRVTAQLIEAEQGFHLWSETYDRKLADLFELQDELSAAIAEGLQARLNPQPKPSQDVATYQLYLQASELLDRHSRPNLMRAIGLLREAVERDPGFARAHGRLAHALNQARHLMPESEGLGAVRRHAERAAALDSSLVEAQNALMLVHGQTGDWLAGAAAYSRAIQSDPNDPLAEMNSVTFLHVPLGRLEAGRIAAARAISLAPGAALPYAVACVAAGALDDYGGEIRSLLAKAEERDFPMDRPPGSVFKASVAFHAGHLDEAAALMKESFPSTLREAGRRVCDLAYAAMAGGPREPALAEIGQILETPAYEEALRATLGSYSKLIYWSALLGSLDLAYAATDRIVAGWRKAGVLATVDLYPIWSPSLHAFRADPRFQQLVEELGMFPYWERHGPPDGYVVRGGRLAAA